MLETFFYKYLLKINETFLKKPYKLIIIATMR